MPKLARPFKDMKTAPKDGTVVQARVMAKNGNIEKRHIYYHTVRQAWLRVRGNQKYIPEDLFGWREADDK